MAFAKSSLKYPLGALMFPQNQEHDQDIRNPERFKVNFAHTESYRKSAVPYCQRLLNQDAQAREVQRKDAARRREGGG